MRVAEAITWDKSGLPPTWCNTLGYLDFRREPLPAARIANATSRGRFGGVFMEINIYRGKDESL